MAVSGEQLIQQMQDAGFTDIFGVKKEFRFLAKNLNPGEQLKGSVRGLRSGGTILMAVTNQRVIFLDAGLMWGVKVSTVPLSKVNGVSEERHLVMSNVIIVNGAEEIVLANIMKDQASKIVRVLQQVLAQYHQQLDQLDREKSSQNHPLSVADELLKYKKLLDEKVITPEEFVQQKAKLLGEDQDQNSGGIGI